MEIQNFSASSPYTMNNATEIFRSKFNPQKFTDQNFLYNNYTKDVFTVYKGLLRLWNMRGIVNTPLLNMTELQNQVMYLGNMEGRFRYSIPYDIGLPYVIEDIEKDNPFPGRDGQPFKIKLNENVYTNTDVLTVDEREGLQVVVTDEEIVQEEDGYVYTVQLIGTSRRNMYYPHTYMQPGKKYMKIQNINGEYSRQMSSITTNSGMMQLEVELGNGHRSVTHWVTGYADMMRLTSDPSGKSNPNLARTNQILENTPAVTLYANKDANGKIIPDSISWHSTVELLCRAEMEKMTDKGLMWAQGGWVSGGHNRRKTRVAPGLYSQLRSGNYLTYVNRITLEQIEQQVANLFMGTDIPVEQRRTEIQTGTGGLNQISTELQEKFKQVVPFLTQTKDYPGGVFYGGQFDAGFVMPRFTQFFSPIAGWINFTINKALDNIEGNGFDNFVGNYPDSSYTYMILDVTNAASTNAVATDRAKYRVDDGFNEGSNIVLVKPQDYGDTYWGYIDGTHSHLGAPAMKGMQSASDFNGYQIWMKSFGAIWVKDVTRTLLIERERPGIVYNVDLSIG